MEEILREVLSEDKSLLCRRDELINILEKRVPGNLRRDFAPIKKALSLNVGEKFFVGESDRDAVKREVEEILKSSGMQTSRVDFVIDTFAEALDWYKPLVPATENFNASKENIHTSKVNTLKAASVEPEENLTVPEPESEPEPMKIEEPVPQEKSHVETAPPQNNYQQKMGSSLPQNHKGTIFTTEGRLNRWAYFLQGLKICVLFFIGVLFAGSSNMLSILIFIVAAIGGWMIGIRRMHDLDKSGWWLLICFIPYINFVFSLYMIFAPGTRGYNRYGKDPLTE